MSCCFAILQTQGFNTAQWSVYDECNGIKWKKNRIHTDQFTKRLDWPWPPALTLILWKDFGVIIPTKESHLTWEETPGGGMRFFNFFWISSLAAATLSSHNSFWDRTCEWQWVLHMCRNTCKLTTNDKTYSLDWDGNGTSCACGVPGAYYYRFLTCHKWVCC